MNREQLIKELKVVNDFISIMNEHRKPNDESTYQQLLTERDELERKILISPKYLGTKVIKQDIQEQESLANLYRSRKSHYLESHDPQTAIQLARKDCGLE